MMKSQIENIVFPKAPTLRDTINSCVDGILTKIPSPGYVNIAQFGGQWSTGIQRIQLIDQGTTPNIAVNATFQVRNGIYAPLEASIKEERQYALNANLYAVLSSLLPNLYPIGEALAEFTPPGVYQFSIHNTHKPFMQTANKQAEVIARENI